MNRVPRSDDPLVPIWASWDRGELVTHPAWFFYFASDTKSDVKTKLSKVPGGVESLHPIWAPGGKDEPVAQPAWFLYLEKLLLKAASPLHANTAFKGRRDEKFSLVCQKQNS